jgi:hypothetical protein
MLSALSTRLKTCHQTPIVFSLMRSLSDTPSHLFTATQMLQLPLIACCYDLILPLLFLTPLHLFIHLPTKLLIPGTALLLSLTSLILFPLTPLTSSPALPQNQLVLVPYYALGHIPLTASLSSAPIVLMETLQSFRSRLVPIRLMLIPWSILPFAMNMSALLITLMEATDGLGGSYLISFISMDLL